MVMCVLVPLHILEKSNSCAHKCIASGALWPEDGMSSVEEEKDSFSHLQPPQPPLGALSLILLLGDGNSKLISVDTTGFGEC